jgi:hypothetical protein
MVVCSFSSGGGNHSHTFTTFAFFPSSLSLPNPFMSNRRSSRCQPPTEERYLPSGERYTVAPTPPPWNIKSIASNKWTSLSKTNHKCNLT